jgi:hypothetical protein
MALPLRFIVSYCALASTGAQFGIGGKEKKTSVPNKLEVKLVGCEICERTVMEAVYQTQQLKLSSTHGKLREEDVLEMLKNICLPLTAGGRWLTSMDIVTSKYDGVFEAPGGPFLGSHKSGWKEEVEKSDFLLIREHDEPGHCEEECATVSQSCEVWILPITPTGAFELNHLHSSCAESS